MYAVVVEVAVEDVGTAVPFLREQVVPRVSAMTGFRAGYWLEARGDRGLSLIVFDSEEHARTAAAAVQPPPGVRLESVDVREIVAHG